MDRLFQIFISVLIPVLASGNACFTWLFKTKNTLNLNYSLTDALDFCVYYKLGNKIATCRNHSCQLENDVDTYNFISEINQYRFTIYREMTQDLDGNWSIMYGDQKQEQIHISFNKGIVNDTEVNVHTKVIRDENNRIRFIYLSCSSCRVPYKHRAEFLINNISEDTIILDPNTGHCYTSGILCNPDMCNCSKSGTSFMRAFHHTEMNSIYSCDMIFNDEMTGARFSKIASVYVNATGVFPLPSKTQVVKNPTSASHGTNFVEEFRIIPQQKKTFVYLRKDFRSSRNIMYMHFLVLAFLIVTLT